MDKILKSWEHLEDFAALSECVKRQKQKLEEFQLGQVEEVKEQVRKEKDREWTAKFREYKDQLEAEVSVKEESMRKEFMDKERLRKLEIKEEMSQIFAIDKKYEMNEKLDKEKQIMQLEFRNDYEKEIYERFEAEYERKMARKTEDLKLEANREVEETVCKLKAETDTFITE